MSESMADFEKEIEESFRKINQGDILEGVITSVGDEVAYVDINFHKQGTIKKADFSDDPAFSMQSVKVGDTYTTVVLAYDDGEGNVALSVKEAAKATAWNTVQTYLEEGTALTLKVSGTVNKGVIVYVEGLRGFIPASHLDIGFVEDTSTFVDKEVECKVITADQEKNRLVLSVKELLYDKRRADKQAKLDSIEVGSVVTGTVESLMPYGAFVALGDGISGLVHVSQIANKRIETPAEVLKKGEEVTAKVIKVADGKISLSIKALHADSAAPAPKKERPRRERKNAEPSFNYKDEGNATTGLGALLAGLKLD